VEAEDQYIDPTETGEQKHQSHAGKLILAVIVITLIAVLLVPGHKDEQETPSPARPIEHPSLLETQTTPASPETGEVQTAEHPSAPAPSETATSPGEAGTAAPPAADDRPGAAARRLIRELRTAGNPDLERAWQAARGFEQSGRTDDALLLYFFAAREGHGPAAMKLARAADPASFHEGGLFAQADPLQAYKWYGRAAAAGVDEARQAQAQLRARVEKAAAAGDEQALRLMLQWK
jgi:TPR repeat protein